MYLYDFSYYLGALHMDIWERKEEETEYIRTLKFDSIGEGFRWIEEQKAKGVKITRW